MQDINLTSTRHVPTMALSRRPAGVLLWVALAVAAAALPGAAAARPGVGAHRSLLQGEHAEPPLLLAQPARSLARSRGRRSSAAAALDPDRATSAPNPGNSSTCTPAHVAHPAPPTAPAGYQFFLGNDTQGLDVKQMPGATVAQLAAACDAEPACNGFNSWGWLKYGIKNRTYWSDVSATRGAGAGLYVKNGLEPGSLHPQSERARLCGDQPAAAAARAAAHKRLHTRSAATRSFALARRRVTGAACGCEALQLWGPASPRSRPWLYLHQQEGLIRR